MTQTFSRAADPAAPAGDAPPTNARSTRRTVAMLAVVALVVGAAAAIYFGASDDGSGDQTADVSAQGAADDVLFEDAATLTRRADGLFATLDIPTPAPGSYDYPTSDLVPPWAEPHPPVSPGASDAPEVYTAWLFAFNDPSSCTDDACDADDLGADTAARGGGYQLDGRIADGGRLVLTGTIRVGQDPANGARLDDPAGAEVHLAIAPHGRSLADADLWRQLNGPVGNPEFWWGSTFLP